jgi:hypothetical protein
MNRSIYNTESTTPGISPDRRPRTSSPPGPPAVLRG